MPTTNWRLNTSLFVPLSLVYSWSLYRSFCGAPLLAAKASVWLTIDTFFVPHTARSAALKTWEVYLLSSPIGRTIANISTAASRKSCFNFVMSSVLMLYDHGRLAPCASPLCWYDSGQPVVDVDVQARNTGVLTKYPPGTQDLA